jgi:hypothetical protein
MSWLYPAGPPTEPMVPDDVRKVVHPHTYPPPAAPLTAPPPLLLAPTTLVGVVPRLARPGCGRPYDLVWGPFMVVLALMRMCACLSVSVCVAFSRKSWPWVDVEEAPGIRWVAWRA